MIPGSTIESIQAEYKKSVQPWCVGFSGGKDSSTVLKLVFNAVERTATRTIPVFVVYCDTGVEIPLVRSQVRSTLTRFEQEASSKGLPFSVRIAEPELDQRFF